MIIRIKLGISLTTFKFDFFINNELYYNDICIKYRTQ